MLRLTADGTSEASTPAEWIDRVNMHNMLARLPAIALHRYTKIFNAWRSYTNHSRFHRMRSNFEAAQIRYRAGPLSVLHHVQALLEAAIDEVSTGQLSLLARHRGGGEHLTPAEFESEQAVHCKFLGRRTSALVSAAAATIQSYRTHVLQQAEQGPEVAALDILSEV